MRYMAWQQATPQSEAATPLTEKETRLLNEFHEEAIKAGVLVDGGGLFPSSEAVKISAKDGEVSVVDGPFAETKELIAGYAVLEVKSKEEAVEWSRRFYRATGDGVGYLAPMYEAPE